MNGATGRHLLAADLAAALAITATYVGLAHLSPGDGQPTYAGPGWLAWLVAAGVGLPVAARRFVPVPALAAVLAAMTAATLLDLTREPYVAAALVTYLVGLAEPARRSVPAIVVALGVTAGGVYVGEAVVTPSGSPQDAAGTAGLALLTVGGAWAAGVAVRRRRAEARRDQRRQARLALDEQRLQIARDLHDVVSHNLSVIAVRAGVAAHVADTAPHEAHGALVDIEATSRSALTEMRRTLGVLRSGQAPLGPVPGLDDLGRLADDARRAGVAVELAVTGTEPLGDGDALTVYRVVQEGLTNVVRHAAPTSCRVGVHLAGGEARIEVADRGPHAGTPARPSPPAAGYGLTGVRERARLYGGTVEAGPRPDGGFTLVVLLPLSGREP